MRMLRMGLITAGLALVGGGVAVAWVAQDEEANLRLPSASPDDTSSGDQSLPEKRDPPASPREFDPRAMSRYAIEPPDLLRIEVVEAIPGRPITGERLVRADGTISLDFYGTLEVAGLTLPEIKAKVVNHLRMFLSDEALGLVSEAEPGQRKAVDPVDTDRVVVELAQNNSKVYYVQGDVRWPGRILITGHETVLDALHRAHSLLESADPGNITLVRPAGGPGADAKKATILRIDYGAIVDRGDMTTNYQLLPGDRVVVHRHPSYPFPVYAPEPAREAVPMNREIAEKRIEEIERELGELAEELENVKVHLRDEHGVERGTEGDPAP